MQDLLQQLINGLTLGCIYGLLAISYSLIFGVLRVINFAIGEAMMVGAFSAIGLVHLWAQWQPVDPLVTGCLGLVAAVVGAIGFSLLTELIAFRPILYRRRTLLLLGLISSLGLSIATQNVFLHFVDSGNVNFPVVDLEQKIPLGGATVTATQIAIVAVAFVLMGTVGLFVNRTRFGRQIRAVRDNRDLAAEHGVSSRRAARMTFVLAGLLAGVAGYAIGSYYGVARYNMGFAPGIKAFAAAIFGGIGDVYGGVIGGIAYFSCWALVIGKSVVLAKL